MGLIYWILFGSKAVIILAGGQILTANVFNVGTKVKIPKICEITSKLVNSGITIILYYHILTTNNIETEKTMILLLFWSAIKNSKNKSKYLRKHNE